MLSYIKGMFLLNRLNNIQYSDIDNILEIQNSSLKRIINHAYNNNNYYNLIFKSINLRPSDITTKEDLNKIPILQKKDVKKNIASLISREYDITNLTELKTSGSTGSPLYLYIDKNEILFRQAIHLRANMSIGQKIFDKWITVSAPHHEGKTSSLQRYLNIFCPRHISIFFSEDVKNKMLQKFQPDILDSYASSLYLIAKSIDENKINNIEPKFCISSSDILRDSYRKYIEDVFQAPVYDQYACVEFGRMAWECPEKVGYHTDSDNLIIQIVDDDGEEVAPGEIGEIVITSLFNYVMPFVRYSIGDLGVYSDESCSCGRTLPLIKSIEGRKDSMIMLPDGREISPRAFSIAMGMFNDYQLIDQFKVVQHKKDTFQILVSLENKEKDLSTLEDELLKHMNKIFHYAEFPLKFEVEFVDEISMEKTGKHRYVISHVTNNFNKTN